MAIDAFILDLDGTLVDANGLHARAWRQALEDFGYRVGEDRILLEIGKGGSMLVPALLGREAEEAHGDALRDRHDERYLELVDEEGVRVFPGARELFDALKARGLKSAIATASKKESLEKVVEAADLPLFDLADVVTTDSDVEASKPNPDTVAVAAERLGLSPAQCVMVGDTPYDVEAARRAGVLCIGLTTGAHDEAALYRAGARVVYADVAALGAQLDEAAERCTPGPVRLTAERMGRLMDEALAEARGALEEGNVPIGCVVARGDGTVVARGRSRTAQTGHFLRHAEMVAFERLDGQVPLSRRELILVTTLEPCVMCYGAAMEARVDTILYALEAPSNGGVERCAPMQSPGMIVPRVVPGIRRAESRALFEQWLEKNPDHPFGQDLLAQV